MNDYNEDRFMNVYNVLKKDHEKVSQLFEQLMETSNQAVKTREKLFGQLKAELEVHTEAEESIFYPALKDPEETHEITLEAIEEHHVVDQLLGELDESPKDSDEWIAKLTVLKENVEHHVEEEEEEMFPKARKVLSDSEAEEMGAQVEQKKKTLRKAS